MIMISVQRSTWRRTSQIGIRPKLCIGFKLSTTQPTTHQLTNIFSLTRKKGVQETGKICLFYQWVLPKITPLQKELLWWYFIMGHILFQYVQWLICTGSIKVQLNIKAVTNYELPKCSYCEFWNGCHWTNQIKMIKKNPMKDQNLKKDHLLNG